MISYQLSAVLSPEDYENYQVSLVDWDHTVR